MDEKETESEKHTRPELMGYEEVRAVKWINGSMAGGFGNYDSDNDNDNDKGTEK